MEQFPRRLLTVVTEAVLERELVAELESLGVRGYTITDARGKGSRGRRQSDWAQEGNIRIEIVCDASLAERVAARLRERYYDHYAMVLFLQDVSVLRPDKF
jgi:nitrogen regulatory protein PII